MKKEKKPQSITKKVVKTVAFSLLGVIGVCILTVGSYLLYVVIDYDRIEDNQVLTVNSHATKEKVELNKELKATTFNIGFGAYSDEYSFFMDKGYAKDNQTMIHGQYGKAISYEDALNNTNGCVELSKTFNSDFYLFQEVDKYSDRAYKIDQENKILEAYQNVDSTYAVNFHSAYLFYPFNDPHGKSLAGLSTLSEYKINEATRKRYTISDGFDKYLDLDRCFSVNRLSTENNKELVLINSHMSAYDEGGKIRNKQLNELNEFMKEETLKGNYVVCGGDFNHNLLSNNPLYPQYTQDKLPYSETFTQRSPDWINFMYDEKGETVIDNQFKIYSGDNEPTCRACDSPYDRGFTYVTAVDGFIVSNNVEVSKCETVKIGSGFEFSDHQPVNLTFKLL